MKTTSCSSSTLLKSIEFSGALESTKNLAFQESESLPTGNVNHGKHGVFRKRETKKKVIVSVTAPHNEREREGVRSCARDVIHGLQSSGCLASAHFGDALLMTLNAAGGEEIVQPLLTHAPDVTSRQLANELLKRHDMLFTEGGKIIRSDPKAIGVQRELLTKKKNEIGRLGQTIRLLASRLASTRMQARPGNGEYHDPNTLITMRASHIRNMQIFADDIGATMHCLEIDKAKSHGEKAKICTKVKKTAGRNPRNSREKSSHGEMTEGDDMGGKGDKSKKAGKHGKSKEAPHGPTPEDKTTVKSGVLTGMPAHTAIQVASNSNSTASNSDKSDDKDPVPVIDTKKNVPKEAELKLTSCTDFNTRQLTGTFTKTWVTSSVDDAFSVLPMSVLPTDVANALRTNGDIHHPQQTKTMQTIEALVLVIAGFCELRLTRVQYRTGWSFIRLCVCVALLARVVYGARAFIMNAYTDFKTIIDGPRPLSNPAVTRAFDHICPAIVATGLAASTAITRKHQRDAHYYIGAICALMYLTRTIYTRRGTILSVLPGAPSDRRPSDSDDPRTPEEIAQYQSGITVWRMVASPSVERQSDDIVDKRPPRETRENVLGTECPYDVVVSRMCLDPKKDGILAKFVHFSGGPCDMRRALSSYCPCPDEPRRALALSRVKYDMDRTVHRSQTTLEEGAHATSFFTALACSAHSHTKKYASNPQSGNQGNGT